MPQSAFHAYAMMRVAMDLKLIPSLPTFVLHACKRSGVPNLVVAAKGVVGTVAAALTLTVLLRRDLAALRGFREQPEDHLLLCTGTEAAPRAVAPCESLLDAGRPIVLAELRLMAGEWHPAVL